MKQYGFTLIELVITITIMTILLALAVVNLESTQANQRDAERASDTAAIANNLETYYKTGVSPTTALGRYPSTAVLTDGETSARTFFPAIDLEILIAPEATSVATSFIPATNNVETATGVLPQPTKSQYVYQPIQTNTSLCTDGSQECRRFSLYYRTEIDNTVKKVTSRHQ
jgi:prepilin-type N-terminal cleavage/methylation domain-containing protein